MMREKSRTAQASNWEELKTNWAFCWYC